MRTYDLSPMFRYSVGFDRMQRIMDSALTRTEASYPPYNIETDGKDSYRISVAVAGFSKKELAVTVENETLTISGTKSEDMDPNNYLHRGIAGRNFKLQFNLAEHIKIGVANVEHGVLAIDLEREVPDALKPRQIKIGVSPAKAFATSTKKMIAVDEAA
jgi:molecular chaperone IbpA